MTDTPPPPGVRIGDAAPNFIARSTVGDVSLADYKGRWLILFSHPADFTPVCTSEFVALARASAEFEKRGCALLALSVDSLFAHFAWLRAIRDRFGVEVRFPIVEDPTLVIGTAYGMAAAGDTDSATVRSTFFIDPDGIVRVMTCYPSTIGRSVEEMIRTLDALQAADANDVLVPEGWQPGQAVFEPINPDLDAVFAAGDASDWFLTERKRADR